ncbi:hypothetical protein HerbRD11066_57780 [Herbidospora sp. RD11066]
MYKWIRKGVRLEKGKLTVRSIVRVTLIVAVGLPMIAGPASADVTPGIRVYNRMDGSRLAVLENGTAFGLRSPTLHDSTARWSVDERADGHTVFRNEQADKCLQPGTAAPAPGDPLVIRACDGSPLQDWSRRAEETLADSPTGWGTFRPRLDPGLAIAVGERGSLHLDADQNSTDRLWRLARGTNTWW